jgi:mevalonate kinase
MKNSTRVTVSAPGKLMIVGEHAAVYGHPCIVTAVSSRIHVTCALCDDGAFTLHSPDVGIDSYTKPMHDVGGGTIPREVQYIEKTLAQWNKQQLPIQGLTIDTHAEFSSTVGFGSSSGVVVATLCALMKLCNVSIDEKELFTMAYSIIQLVQGRVSGFDVASALYGGTLYFSGNGETIEPLVTDSIPFVVGYTGVKADTKTLVDAVAAKKEKYPQKVNRIFIAIEKLVNEVKERIGEQDWDRVGRLMDFNQEYLRDLGVSSEHLETLISAAKEAGAYGAKLSGAGGGDCMIALHPKGARGKQKIIEAIQKAGGTVMDVAPGAVGVQAEPGGGT